MTASDLRTALDRLGLSQSEAARRWGVSLSTIQRCCRDTPIPPYIQHIVVLELRVAAFEAEVALLRAQVAMQRQHRMVRRGTLPKDREDDPFN